MSLVEDTRFVTCGINSLASITVPSSILRLIKISKVAKELVILSDSSLHLYNFLLYFLDVNSKMPPTQVEMVFTTPNDALIGKPTTVKALPTVAKLLTTPTALAPVNACSNLL